MQKFKSYLITAAFLFIFANSFAFVGFAYDNDTHFWLTYYLAKKAGYTDIQATQIASANVSVDFDRHVMPVVSVPATFLDWRHPQAHFQQVRSLYHALPWSKSVFDKANIPEEKRYWWNPTEAAELKQFAAEAVADRQQEFWSDTLKDNDNPGFFLHYLQDTFAHENFLAYIGHAGYSWVDFLSSDQDKAERMAFETMKYLIIFQIKSNPNHAAQIILHKTPADFDFNNIQEIKSKPIEDFLFPETIEEIKRTVTALCEVNKTSAKEPNQLVTIWSEIKKEKIKRKEKRPPRVFLSPLNYLRRNSKVPASFRARDKIKIALNISDEKQLPDIWLYDYNKFGKKETAKKIRVYKKDISIKEGILITSSQENKTTEVKRKIENGERRCLPFKLVNHTRTELPKCSEIKKPLL